MDHDFNFYVQRKTTMRIPCEKEYYFQLMRIVNDDWLVMSK